MPEDTGGDDSDDEDVSGSIPLGDVFETLSALLEQLDELDLDAGERRSDTVRRGDATFDYDVSIGTIAPGGEGRNDRRSPNWDIKGESEDHEYRVRVNDADGKLVVVADLPAASADDVSVGTTDNDDALEIRVDGDVVRSVPLDWGGASVTEVAFTNQVLEVHVEPQGADTADDENDDGGTDT
ncbi:MAG: HSP20 family molecular chaperone IbpA [Haloarculaceae archaeon]|jgi:HSP20 family molecular chaperone IbpA